MHSIELGTGTSYRPQFCTDFWLFSVSSIFWILSMRSFGLSLVYMRASLMPGPLRIASVMPSRIVNSGGR